jgi:amino acid adenylation domain-containing protein
VKILLIQPIEYVSFLDGAAKANRVLMEGLRRKGHECRVLGWCGRRGPQGATGYAESLRARGIALKHQTPDVVEFDRNGVEVWTVLDAFQWHAQLQRALTQFAPDCVLVSEDHTLFLLEVALEASEAPVVYIAHSQASLPFGPESFVEDRSPDRAALLRRASGILTVSHYVRRYIEQWGQASAEVIYFPAYGTGPFPHFGRFDDGSVTMINPSSFKGISIFLELARRFPHVAFAAIPTWGTSQEDRQALTKLANVSLWEPVEQIDQLYRRSRLILMPSLWGEAFGQVAIEAMLRGIPVLASQVGGLPEAKLGVDYLLPVRPISRYESRSDERHLPVPIVPEQDVEPWAAALKQVLTQRGVYEELSAMSRRRASEFVATLSIDPFERLLERTVQQHRPARPQPACGEREPASPLSHLSPTKRALLAVRLRKKRPVASLIERVERGQEGTRYPLSYSQERLWFLQQLDETGAAYNTALTYRVLGRLNARALERSLQTLLARHETLRTCFTTDEAGRPFQQIMPRCSLSLPVVRLEEHTRQEKEQHARSLLGAALAERFNLGTGPLLRVQLLQLEPNEHLFVLVIHHILFDGWSAGVFARELCHLYQAFSTGRQPELPGLPLQYVDYAAWQRKEYEGGGSGAADLEFWRQKLGGQLPVLNLPIYRPRPKRQSFRGADATFIYPAHLANRLAELAQRAGGTLFMVMLAAFKVLLHRYTRDEELVVGTLSANRERPELEGLIGLFLNSLVLRTDVSGNPRFLELLERVRDVTLEAYAHQTVPVERLVAELRPRRDASHHPLFQVLFVLQNAPTTSIELGDLELIPLPFESTASDVDLELQFMATSEGLLGRVIYNTDLLDATAVTRLMGQFRTLLEGIVQAPETHLSELPLLTAEEREQQVEQQRGRALAFAWEQGLLGRIEEHARSSPERLAVESPNGERLTYGELSAQSTRLAEHLRKLGVGPEVTVAVCLERSPGLLVALLAVLKAGGAYLPLDVAYPRERLEYMLRDSQARLVLTVRARAEQLPAPATCRIVCLDEEPAAASPLPVQEACGPVLPDNAAYIIYTSGSMGTPKGVVVRHHSLLNYALTAVEDYGLRPSDRVLQFASISWDTSAEEIFPTLVAGATLVLRPQDLPGSYSQFLEMCERQRLTLLNLPTAFWHELTVDLERQRLPVPPSLRLLVIGGEQASWDRVRAWKRCVGRDLRLVNTYGCTEATAVSTLCELSQTGTGSAEHGEAPIGRAIGNVHTYVLDPSWTPVPPGVPGELYLGGEGLARGYVGAGALTAERFLPDPFSRHPGARMYRTGDLVQMLPDGRLKYLGRLDAQVKVRGIRVELGEIEAVLGQHPAVTGVVLTPHTDATGQTALVAYVVLDGDRRVTVEEVRRYASERLPEFMVPATVVSLEEFPQTPNGKIDRKRLPAPAALPRTRPAEPTQGPRDDIERRLTRCWQEVLGGGAVGPREDFFELGGHSLMAVRLITRVEREFGRRLPLSALLQGPTIEKMAALLRTREGTASFPVLVPLQPDGDGPPFFCIPGSGGNVLYLRELARRLGAAQPFYGLQARGLDGQTPPLTRVEEMASHYVKAILSVQPEGPYFLGGHSFGSSVAFEVAYQLEQRGQPVALLAAFDNPAPFSSDDVLPCASWSEAQWTDSIARLVERMFVVDLALPYSHLANRSAEEQLELLLRRLQAVGILPPEAEVAQVRGFVQVFKANTLARYTPHGKLSAPVSLFRAEVFRREDVDGRMTKELSADPAWGWRHQTRGPVTVYRVPGDHLTMLAAPQVDGLAHLLRSSLATVRRGP